MTEPSEPEVIVNGRLVGHGMAGMLAALPLMLEPPKTLENPGAPRSGWPPGSNGFCKAVNGGGGWRPATGLRLAAAMSANGDALPLVWLSAPDGRKVPDCSRCLEHLSEDGWAILEACASVGIEHGKSTTEMAERYFETFHAKGHSLP